MDKLAYSITEAAQVLGVSRPTVYALIKQPGFPVFQIGGRKLRVKTRPMAMSDLLIALAERELAEQEVLPQFRQWADATLKRNLKRREAALARQEGAC